MNIERYRHKVSYFNYNSKEEFEDYETKFKVNITPLRIPYHGPDENSSTIGVRIDFSMVFEEFVVAGSVSQVNKILDKVIEDEGDISSEEVNELIEPVMQVLQKLTFDVAKIALDNPNLELEFDELNEE